MKVFRSHLLVCGGTGCHASGSIAMKKALVDEINKRGLSEEIKIVETGCNGFCAMGPIIVVYPEGLIYMNIRAEDVPELVEEHFIKGRPVERLFYREPGKEERIPSMQEIPFFALQDLRVLRNRGLIDPENIEEYIARDGYAGMAKALTEMTPEQIVQEVLKSGLRGRGGAGFPTGLKWQFAQRSPGETKYVLCNADEGDPGAFMDRSVLEADPHAVLEGMVIAAKAIGSKHGYIYCRAEYPLAIHRLNVALGQARESGLLGKDILGTGFDFDIEVYQGAGAFVCGEETALMTSIEGKRGMPRPRPPFPAVAGLWAKPSVLNNVETLANIGQIILRGGEWYASVGTERSKGTKVFALTGDVNNVGLVEVPMGTTLGTIIYDIGGGIPGGKKFKAAQLGGPSGGCIPVQHLNASVDYEKVAELGAIMGSGGLIVMNEDKCAVDMARFFMDFCKDESCGKCTPCREGTQRMLDILTKICKGKGKEGDIELLESMATVIKDAALCGLGQTAPNPVLSTIRYFRDEYEEHIRDKKCRAAVCSALFKSPCQHTCPIGMDIPAYIALIRDNRLEDAYTVMLKTNPFPSVCGRVCDHQCQTKCRRGLLDEPVAIKFLKRFITDNAPRPQIRPVGITRKEKIAVIGAGPSGLTCARDLALRGYAVTVFEELPTPGGMLSWGIPSYRLPQDHPRQGDRRHPQAGRRDQVRHPGGPRSPLGRREQGLRLCLPRPRRPQEPAHGRGRRGSQGGLGRRRVPPRLQRGRGRLEERQEEPRLKGGRHRRRQLRHRRGPHGPAAGRRGDDPLPAPARGHARRGRGNRCRRARGHQDRVPHRAAPHRRVGGTRHRDRVPAAEARGLRQQRPQAARGHQGLRVHPERGHRDRRHRPDAGSLLRARRERREGEQVVLLRREGTTSESQTTSAKYFAGGDAVTGPSTVIKAIAAGHGAAEDIDGFIRKQNGEPAWVPPAEEQIHIPFVVDEETEECPQAHMPELEADFRRKNFVEVELGYKKDQALKEATRCLRCDAEI